MAHVITRPCCNDASCVSVCPVNCIHPTPSEPDFAVAEMLYIDPQTCIDCGACIDECPVEAIVPDDALEAGDEAYLEINAAYYRDHPVDSGIMEPSKPPKLPDEDFEVAIVGAGPSGFYVAEQLVRHPRVHVHMFDRLPTPYGLIRAGVAPDHAATKNVERTFAAVAAKRNFTYHLDVEVGTHITHAELTERFHAVVYTTGASGDRTLGVPGEDLEGVVAATDFVAWYNGHPDHVDDHYDLSGSRAVVIGNGNVALDVARILTRDPAILATTDIADHALEALRSSKIEEVVILGRRGIAQAAYTNSEFLALTNLDDVDVIIDAAELSLDPATKRAVEAGSIDSTIETKIRLAHQVAERPARGAHRRITFTFLSSPRRLLGDQRLEAIDVGRNEYSDSGAGAVVASSEEAVELDASLVIRAVGYRSHGIDTVPFSTTTSTIPNVAGRVHDSQDQTLAGVYVAGWIKRGATGGIGQNRQCATETAHAILDDLVAGVLPAPTRNTSDLDDLLTAAGTQPIGLDGWKRIDAHERAAGKPTRRPRQKVVDRKILRAIACTTE